jgi:outer membrane protein TolC
MNRIVGAACVALAAALPASAADSLSVSLTQALDMALDLNPGIRSARLSTQVRERAVDTEAARFGRSFSTDVSHRTERSPSISALENVQTSTSSVISMGVGMAQELAGGGRLGLTFSNSRYSSNAAYQLIDPVYQSGLALEYQQPLLRGRGRVNRTGLHLARNDRDVAAVALEEEIRNLTAQVSTAYWDLYFALENLRVQRQLAAGANRVLETVRARAEMGADPRTTILQAEVGVARRDEDIVVAEGAVRQTEDRLRSLMGLDQDPAQWQTRLVPTSSPLEDSPIGDLGSGVEAALASSPAYRKAEIQLQSLDLQADLARDNTRPEVNLTARVGLTGIGASYGDNAEVLRDAEGRSWVGGLSLELPLGRSADAERYRQRLLEKERGQVDLERMRLDIVQQVREQHRLVEINRRRSEVAGLSVRLAEQNVAEEEQRLALGLSTVRQVLDAQDELAEARVSRLRAIVDYNRALIEWGRLTGEGP